jgi:hypothetical protein
LAIACARRVRNERKPAHFGEKRSWECVRMHWALNCRGGVNWPLTAITRCWTRHLSLPPLCLLHNPLQVAELYGKAAWLIILVS